MGLEDWMRGLLGRAKADVTDKVAAAAAEKALADAKAAAAKAGDAMLDDLETALLGKKGASDEILGKESDVDPLARARAAYGLDGKDAPAPAVEERLAASRKESSDREERARAELAELKRKLGKT